jgi:hypothetical protein
MANTSSPLPDDPLFSVTVSPIDDFGDPDKPCLVMVTVASRFYGKAGGRNAIMANNAESAAKFIKSCALQILRGKKRAKAN